MTTGKFEDKQPGEGEVTGDEKDGSSYFAPVLLGLCVVLVAWMAFWHFSNRKWIGPTFGADIEFVEAPETAVPGKPTRFTVRVEQDNTERPLAGRPMDIKITPSENADILSVSGAEGVDSARITSGTGAARGMTDAAGNVKITVLPKAPGKYTLIALDSASNQEGTVNFEVSMAPEPGE